MVETRMTNCCVPLPRVTSLSIAILFMISSLAAAQTPAPLVGAAPAAVGAPAFAGLVLGRNVRVSKQDGTSETGVVKSVSTAGLVMDDSTTVPFGEITRVTKVTHRIRNGILIGLASGVGPLLIADLAAGDESCLCPEIYLPVAALGAGIGAGIGGLVHAINHRGDVIYDARRPTTTMTFVPILSPTRKGIAFSMTWR
jgi:hypothetical protein